MGKTLVVEKVISREADRLSGSIVKSAFQEVDMFVRFGNRLYAEPFPGGGENFVISATPPPS